MNRDLEFVIGVIVATVFCLVEDGNFLNSMRTIFLGLVATVFCLVEDGNSVSWQ